MLVVSVSCDLTVDTNRPVSARDLTDYGNRNAVLVRINCMMATFLLFLTHNELADDTRTTVAMVARQNV